MNNSNNPFESNKSNNPFKSNSGYRPFEHNKKTTISNNRIEEQGVYNISKFQKVALKISAWWYIILSGLLNIIVLFAMMGEDVRQVMAIISTMLIVVAITAANYIISKKVIANATTGLLITGIIVAIISAFALFPLPSIALIVIYMWILAKGKTSK